MKSHQNVARHVYDTIPYFDVLFVLFPEQRGRGSGTKNQGIISSSINLINKQDCM